jgi:hypothetical protein
MTKEHQAGAIISGATKPVRRTRLCGRPAGTRRRGGEGQGEEGQIGVHSNKQRVLRDVLDARLKDNGEGKGNKQ